MRAEIRGDGVGVPLSGDGGLARAGVDATVRADWPLDTPRLIIGHNKADREASVGLALSAEAAEGLALDLLELTQESREARDVED